MWRLASAREKLFRLKSVGGDFLDTQLKRCLTTTDITLLGVGHMVGAGIYVLTGTVLRNTAGPGVVLAFLLAGVASLLSALCYAEFGARVPKAGSAYTYAYVTVGEFWAFVIGWNIVLEHMLSAAAVARAWSGYLDSLLGHVLKNATVAAVGAVDVNHFFVDYLDFVACLLVIGAAAFVGSGAKSSTKFNTFFTVINLCVIVFVTLYGFSFADFDLWFTGKHGGFLPFGLKGVLAGAASCFFAYVGFDGMATAGEEASDPARSIPIATFVSMSLVTGAYVLMSSALALMLPYTLVHPTSAFSDAFEQRGALWAKYVVAIGALSGMSASLVGALFALPRCVYAMASDGLLFGALARVHPSTRVPTTAVAVFGGATAALALLFDIETLVELLSIGTLMAYTIVSCSVVILRYKPSGEQPEARAVKSAAGDDSERLVEEDALAGRLGARWEALRPWAERLPPGTLVGWAVLSLSVSSLLLSFTLTYMELASATGVLLCIVLGAAAIGSFALVCGHHQGRAPLRFKVPMVPLLPTLSILINVVLMAHLAAVTWLRLVIWLAIGLVIYFSYGVKHSVENEAPIEESTTYNTLVMTPASESVKLPDSAEPTVAVEHAQPPQK